MIVMITVAMIPSRMKNLGHLLGRDGGSAVLGGASRAGDFGREAFLLGDFLAFLTGMMVRKHYSHDYSEAMRRLESERCA